MALTDILKRYIRATDATRSFVDWLESAAAGAQLADGSVGTNQLANLAVTTGKLALLGVTDAQIAASTITTGKLAFEPVCDVGRLASGWVQFVAAGVNIADTITITTGGVPQIWSAIANGGVPATALEWARSGANGAADAIAFAARVNANATSSVRAVALAVGGAVGVVALFAKLASSGNPALAESTAGVRQIVSAAAFVGAAAMSDKLFCGGTYLVTAADVATWVAAGNPETAIAAVPSVAQPVLVGLNVQVAGALRSTATIRAIFRQSGANEWVLSVQDIGAVLVAGDVISFACVTN